MHIDHIAELASPSRALVSIYLNRPPGPSAAALTDLLKAVRAEADGAPRAVEKSVRADIERIGGLDAWIDSDPSPAFCVFASSMDDLFELSSLPASVWDHASLGRRPYLRPLRWLPGPLRVGVIVADRRKATVFTGTDSRLSQLGDMISGEPLKTNYGGFRGYEEHRVRGHADAEARRVMEEAASRLFGEHQIQPFDYIAVGGHQETLEAVVAHLHPYLRSLPIARFVIDPHTMTTAEVTAVVSEHAAGVRRAREESVVADVLAAIEGTGPGVRGTAAVLRAANAHAVERLVVAGTFSKPGVVCPQCGWLGRDGSACPACGGHTDESSDVVADAMEAVLGAGGAVHQVSVASPLDAHGVGARLRFPV